MARIRIGNDELEFVRKSDNILELEDGQVDPASIFVDENGKIKFKDRDSTSAFMSTLAALGGNSKLMDAAHGPPSNALPPETIVYIDLDDMRLYKRSESGWGTGFGIRGNEGTPGSAGERGKTILYGELNPNSAAMKPQLDSALIGDMYVETGTEAIPVHQMWVKKQSGSNQVQWERLGRQYGRLGVDGSKGDRGNTVFEGAEDPRDITQSSADIPEGFFGAIDGDVYIETDTHKIFKRKNGAWVQRGPSFKGADGAPGQKRNSVYKGTKNPNDSSMQSYLLDAIVGDVYIETDSHLMWKKQYATASLAHPNLWIADSSSFKGSDGSNGLRGRTIYQGTNATSNPNDFAVGDTSAPSGFFNADVDDIYIDTKDYQNWKFVGTSGVNGPWTKVGKSYRPNGAIQGLIDPNLFEAMATSEDATSNFFMYQDEYNQADSNFDFIGDWFAVKEAKVGDTFIDTNDHFTYVKKRKENEMVGGVLKKVWETKGKKFRTSAAIQGLIDPNQFEAMGAAPANTTDYPDKADDWKAVREAKVGDTYIDTDDHRTYIKKTATKITSPGVWVLKGKKFRPSGAIQGLVSPNVFENMPLAPTSLTENLNIDGYTTLAAAGYTELSDAVDDWTSTRAAKVGDMFFDTDDHRTYVKKLATTSQSPLTNRWLLKGRQFRGTQGTIGPNGPKGKGHIYGSGSPALMMSTYGSNRAGWVAWAVSEYGPTKGGDLNEEEAGEDWDEVKAAENGDKYTDSETGSTFTKLGGMWTSRAKNLFKNLPKVSGGKLQFRQTGGTYLDLDGDAIGLGAFKNKTPEGIRDLVDATHLVGKMGISSFNDIKNSQVNAIYAVSLGGNQTISPTTPQGADHTNLDLSDIQNSVGGILSKIKSGTLDEFRVNKTGFYKIEFSGYVKVRSTSTTSVSSISFSVYLKRKRVVSTPGGFVDRYATLHTYNGVKSSATDYEWSTGTPFQFDKTIRLVEGETISFFADTESGSETLFIAYDDNGDQAWLGDTIVSITMLTSR